MSLREQICVALVGHERWTRIGEAEITEPHFQLYAVKLKDIYPLIGGKHKKIKVGVSALDKDGNVQNREFESISGKDAAINTIWGEVNYWITATTGINTYV